MKLHIAGDAGCPSVFHGALSVHGRDKHCGEAHLALLTKRNVFIYSRPIQARPLLTKLVFAPAGRLLARGSRVGSAAAVKLHNPL